MLNKVVSQTKIYGNGQGALQIYGAECLRSRAVTLYLCFKTSPRVKPFETEFK